MENAKEKIESDSIGLANELIQEKFGAEIEKTDILGLGYGGEVLKLETNHPKQKTLVLKLSEVEEESDFENISNNDRIFGTRLTNLMPAYNLLKKK